MLPQGAVLIVDVSTHSRPKAAGNMAKICESSLSGFNSQPPEGGWIISNQWFTGTNCFNSQPPEGGWLNNQQFIICKEVSTHSRPKAAGHTR